FGLSFDEDVVTREKIAIDDRIDIHVLQIVENGVPKDTNIILRDSEVIKSGGKFGGITIDKKLADGQGIRKGVVLNVRILKRKRT
nr:hypothetical protein [Candidatus Sigynarchaeota archaeon]